MNLLKLLFISLILSCSKSDNDGKTVEEIAEQTPQVLLENKEENDFYSFSKESKSDIIYNLYQEVLRKNQNLKILQDEIDIYTNDSIDLLTKSFKKYENINADYWRTIEEYTNEIQDSVVKKETKEIFQKMRLNYEKRISKHVEELVKANSKTLKLRDQEIVMKLIITGDMMYNFQKNELPNLEALKDVNKKLDTLISDTKEFIKINK